MAQTKRKRRTKHRGNAAGAVEARGRTGRAPSTAEKSSRGRAALSSREKRLARYDKPPTWRGAFNRALLAALAMLVISLLLIKKPIQAIILFPIVLGLYIPVGYYTDVWMYRRRQREKMSDKRR